MITMRSVFPLKIFRSLPHQYRWKMTNAFEITEVADKTFDYVIVGGGVSHCTTYWNQLANLEQTAGHTLAARPTEDPSVSVVVLEAGQAHLDDPIISIGIGRTLANLMTGCPRTQSSAIPMTGRILFPWRWFGR